MHQRLIERALYRIASARPCRIIDGPRGEPYLERYFLFRLPGRWLTCYLHRFVDDDPDRGVHDHPWRRAWSVVLTSGYDEYRLVTMPRGRVFHVADNSPGEIINPLRIVKRRVRVGAVNGIRGDNFHRVVLRDGRRAWTLFCHGRRVKGWGFIQYARTGAATLEWYRFVRYWPYAINRETGEDEWWKNKPRGREEPRRAAA